MNRNIEIGCGKKQMKDGVGAQRMSLDQLKEALKNADPALYSREQAYKKKRLEVCKLLAKTAAGKKLIFGSPKASPKKNSPKLPSPSNKNYVNKMLMTLTKKNSPKKSPPKAGKNIVSVSLANFGMAMDPNTGELIPFENMGFEMPMPVNRKMEKDPLKVGTFTKAQAARFAPQPIKKNRRVRTYKTEGKAQRFTGNGKNRSKAYKILENPRVMSFTGNRPARRPMGQVISKDPQLSKNEKKKARIVANKMLNLFNENKNETFKTVVANLVQEKINRGETRKAYPVKVNRSALSFNMIGPVETDPVKLRNYYKSKGKASVARIFNRFASMGKTNKSENISKMPVIKENSPVIRELNKLPGPTVVVTQENASKILKNKASEFMIGGKPCTSYPINKLAKLAATYTGKPVSQYTKMSHSLLCMELEKLQKNLLG